VNTLRGRVALLTGASAGLGPFIARRLHVEGIRLILSARRRELLDKLARELVGSRAIPADLADTSQIERLAAEAGEVDFLIANAGVAAAGEFERYSVEQIVDTLGVNLQAPMLLTRALLPGMLARGRGHIVLMASMAGQVSAPEYAVYSASKAGLRAFGHGLRGELYGTGVKLSIVSPYFVGEAGMWSDSGGRARGEVSPQQVAEATWQAISQDRAEITVAPAPIRLARRLPMAFPELMHSRLVRRRQRPPA
jgi:uncharacterized protein